MNYLLIKSDNPKWLYEMYDSKTGCFINYLGRVKEDLKDKEENENKNIK
jgi:hypothetical protein